MTFLLIDGVCATSAIQQQGTKDVEIQCRFENVDALERVQVIRNNQTVIEAISSGAILSKFNPRKVAVTFTINSKDAMIRLKFTTLRCQDEGLYICRMNSKHADMEVIVTSGSLQFFI